MVLWHFHNSNIAAANAQLNLNIVFRMSHFKIFASYLRCPANASMAAWFTKTAEQSQRAILRTLKIIALNK
jgi:hypothetical protein